MRSKHVNPFDKRSVSNAKKAIARTSKTVKAVAKDTNKTRRRIVKPTRGRT